VTGNEEWRSPSRDSRPQRADRRRDAIAQRERRRAGVQDDTAQEAVAELVAQSDRVASSVAVRCAVSTQEQGDSPVFP